MTRPVPWWRADPRDVEISRLRQELRHYGDGLGPVARLDLILALNASIERSPYPQWGCSDVVIGLRLHDPDPDYCSGWLRLDDGPAACIDFHELDSTARGAPRCVCGGVLAGARWLFSHTNCPLVRTAAPTVRCEATMRNDRC